ncbi:interleukin-34 [Triplophysa dalaica]|uniref:interleukin-34 n=1 Tax=Triplophysa dalaica TaxID=1582913 RepID=UPI0024DF7ABB|nr:interleukin-34 [Triplophysa dalaica]
MVQSECQLLRGLLGFICLIPMCMSTSSELCVSVKTLKDSLNSSLRRRFMKMNFPINYTIEVHYGEVFRLRNISKLKSEEIQPEARDLQELWLSASLKGISKVLRVLPERHPTRLKYLSNLEILFKNFEALYNQHHPKEERDLPDSIQEIWDNMEDQGWKSVTPKSILDNCYRTMLCLFKDCFTEESGVDYCVPNWRKEKKTT